MTKYNVIEDNGGGLTLVVFSTDGEVIYMHTGYEYAEPKQLLDDIQALKDGDDPAGWDGCAEPDEIPAYYDDDNNAVMCKNLDEVYDSQFAFEHYRNGGWCIVADQNQLYPDKMGGSALRVFCQKVMLTSCPNNEFGVAYVNNSGVETIWSGLLEDAIITAANTSRESGAENAAEWQDFMNRHISGNSDMGELAKILLASESAEDYCWAFDPAVCELK